MPDSSISLVAKPTSANGSSFPNALCPSGLLSPAQARAYLNHLTNDQLADLVRTGRLPALRDPSGRLCFSVADLDAIPQGVDPEIAAAEITIIKETSVLDATMATSAGVAAESGSSSKIAFEVILATIDELRRTNARSPQWLAYDAVDTCYGVPEKMLKSWVSAGFVRKSKLGPALQSKSLYNASDINDCLCRIAAGKAPVNAFRKEV